MRSGQSAGAGAAPGPARPRTTCTSRPPGTRTGHAADPGGLLASAHRLCASTCPACDRRGAGAPDRGAIDRSADGEHAERRQEREQPPAPSCDSPDATVGHPYSLRMDGGATPPTYDNDSIQHPSLPEHVPPDLVARPAEDASRVWVPSGPSSSYRGGEPEPPARPRRQSKRNEAATGASRVRATGLTRPSSTRIRGRSRRRVPGRLQASSSLVPGSSPSPRIQVAGRNPARASGILTRGGRGVRLEEHRPLCPSV